MLTRYEKMPECREKVNSASAFSPVVSCVSPASAFRYRGQSGIVCHGLVWHIPAMLISRIWIRSKSFPDHRLKILCSKNTYLNYLHWVTLFPSICKKKLKIAASATGINALSTHESQKILHKNLGQTFCRPWKIEIKRSRKFHTVSDKTGQRNKVYLY